MLTAAHSSLQVAFGIQVSGCNAWKNFFEKPATILDQKLVTGTDSACGMHAVCIHGRKGSRAQVTLSDDRRHWAVAKRKLESTPLRGWL